MDVEPSKKISRAKIEVLARLQRLEASDEMWEEIRRQVFHVLADHLSALADQVAEEEGWTDEDFERIMRPVFPAQLLPGEYGSRGREESG